MKPETKLWLRKKTLMALRALLWRADEWLHRQEVALREDLSGRDQVSAKAASEAEKTDPSQDMLHRAPARPGSETFREWEARKSGIALVTKKEARRRRERVTASAFDLRFSAR
jgi:hypothetical protein